MTDIVSKEDVVTLVNAFYERVLQDVTLAWTMGTKFNTP